MYTIEVSLFTVLAVLWLLTPNPNAAADLIYAENRRLEKEKAARQKAEWKELCVQYEIGIRYLPRRLWRLFTYQSK